LDLNSGVFADSEGLENIVQRLEALADQYGERFEPAGSLLEMVRNGERFYN